MHFYIAYLDMGTGSYVLQVVIATFLGIIFTIRMFWQNIKTKLTNLFTKARKSEPDEN